MAIETKQVTVPSFIDPNEPPIASENPNLTHRLEWADCPVCKRLGMVGGSLVFSFRKGGRPHHCWYLGCKDEMDCEAFVDRANGLAASPLAY